MTRAIAYLRVSTDVQADKGLGLDVQRNRVTEYAKEKGWTLVGVVSEAASGGVREGEVFSYDHRPVLLDLRNRAKGDEFDALLIARYDRLSRDHASLVALERQFKSHGVSVVSAAEETNGD